MTAPPDPPGPAELQHADPEVRARAVKRVRQVDLDDLGLLDAALALCRDEAPLPDDLQPRAPEDPFADFFGGGSAAPPKATIADAARDRLVFTGVIGKPETVDRIAAALDAGATPQLVTAATKLLAETRWTDRLGAVRALAPRLMAADAPLYEVIVRTAEAEHRVMIGAALRPWRSRTVNELLNHGPSKALMEDALAEAVVGGQLEPDEAVAADALALLVSWDSRHTGRVAAALEARFAWAGLVVAVDDPTAAERCRALLDGGVAAPRPLVRKLEEALKSRGDLPHYPIDAWVRYAGGGLDVVRAWKATGRVREALEGFVLAGASGEHPERGWQAAELLLEAGLHERISGAVLAGLGDDENAEQWTRSLFERLACARPEIDGLVDACAALLERHPTLTRAVVPGLMRGIEPARLRALAERMIALAASRPVVRKPARRGLVHEERDGVDTTPLQPLVHALDDAELVARLQDVLPFIRAET